VSGGIGEVEGERKTGLESRGFLYTRPKKSLSIPDLYLHAGS